MIVDIRVHPGSGRIDARMRDGTIHIYLLSPPVDNKANSELIHLLSKSLRIPKTSISIRSGNSSRKKRLSIEWSGKPEDIITAVLQRRNNKGGRSAGIH